MIVRVFDTAVDPGDVPQAIELFRNKVRATIEGFPGCRGIEMLVGVEERSGDLLDVLTISRWDSAEAIEQAYATREYNQVMKELRELFQRTPIVRHFQEPG
ncbi:MAG: Antibiotic biosynthesis monooxygenase [Actinomycetota bacterium]|jgi:heme-degrading monooxygenase HmoA|nr:Antibiotic biosynthesis monooxygenase [Actinomycetota bacterium]